MLTTEQVQSFHDSGVLHMPQLLGGAELDRLRTAADRLQADAMNKLAQPGYLDGVSRESKHWIEHPDDHYVYREKPDGTLGFHRVERMFTQDPAFVRAAMHPALLHHVWQVLERPFWPRGGSLVVKLPHEGAEVRWHQDIPYLYWSTGGHPSKGRPATHPIPNFTTDIYLDDSTPDNGCLWAIPGTHKDGTVDVDKLVAASDSFQLPGAEPLAADAGDVMFHHVAVIHGSPENYAPSQRRTFYVHFMTNETVEDAYSDWPDLMSPEEAVSFWGQALRNRQSEPDAGDYPQFEATPEGIRQL